MERIFNKLVRDNIPQIIEKNGGQSFTRILDDDEYKKELLKKLDEEYKEVLSSTGMDRIEELADMLEVIKALAKVEGYSFQDVENVCEEKSLKRGKFNKKIFLERTID